MFWTSVLEIVKTLGSFVGLATGAFYFYDRFAKGRPIAYLAFKDDKNKTAYVRLDNPGTYSVVVLGVAAVPDVFGVSNDLEKPNVIASAAGKTPSFVMGPNDSKELFIVTKFKNGVPLEVGTGRVTFRVEWRRGNATWLPQLPVSVRTTTQMIRQFSVDKRTFT